jgi:hypothetical protein
MKKVLLLLLMLLSLVSCEDKNKGGSSIKAKKESLNKSKSLLTNEMIGVWKGDIQGDLLTIVFETNGEVLIWDQDDNQAIELLEQGPNNSLYLTDTSNNLKLKIEFNFPDSFTLFDTDGTTYEFLKVGELTNEEDSKFEDDDEFSIEYEESVYEESEYEETEPTPEQQNY